MDKSTKETRLKMIYKLWKSVFDFDRLDNWVQEMKNKGVRVYISEYTNHNNAWREVASFSKTFLMNGLAKERTIKQEKIFCNL